MAVLTFNELSSELSLIFKRYVSKETLEILTVPPVGTIEIVPGHLWVSSSTTYLSSIDRFLLEFKATIKANGETLTAIATEDVTNHAPTLPCRTSLSALVYLAKNPHEGYVK